MYDKAADYYTKSLSLLSLEPENNIAKIANVHLSLGTIYQRTNHLNEAIEHFEQSLKLKSTLLPPLSPELLQPLFTLAGL